ncbi:NADH-quinone oxidoreductase subunit NuoN [Bartonella sp. DGB1]|uniref:NADH-quinone oxidoreductase subunit NuoN n=1 Tax=Bartonella sp. DGB1 TaxID=3239807 RepID=UPI00352549CA
MSHNMLSNLILISPELILAVGSLLLLLVGVFLGKNNFKIIGVLSLILLAVIFYLLIFLPNIGEAFNINGNIASYGLIKNNFTNFISILILIGSFFAILFSFIDYKQGDKFYKFEYLILLLLATLGMLLMVSSGNFLAFYLGLELQSLALYVLVSFNRSSINSSEAGLKYFTLGSLSSGFLLYGISLLYGYIGSIDFVTISHISAIHPNLLLSVALVFIFAGLAFKISAVPFHMWTPDVYQGAPVAITAFIASSSKVAALAILLKISIVSFGSLTHIWSQLIIFMAIVSMFIGALGAIKQTDIKRIIAYSSIGHVGYILVAVVVANLMGTTAVLVYLSIYLVSIIGCFAFISSIRPNNGINLKLSDLSGYGRKNPVPALAITILMFSLAGLPPFAGFFAKFYSFVAAIDKGYWLLALIGIFASVIAAFYYLRFIKIIWADPEVNVIAPMCLSSKLILYSSALLLTSYIIYGGYFYLIAEYAATGLSF